MTLLQDFRFACRLLGTRRVFTLGAITTLALGIAAPVGVFTVVRGVLLRPLPFREPGALVAIFESNPSQGVERAPVPLEALLDWQERSRSFEGIEAYYVYPVGTPMGDGADIVTASVTQNFFTVLGVPPLYRASPQDAGPLISHGLWTRRFGMQTEAVGKRLEQEELGLSFVITGVMPPGFSFPPGVEAWYVTPSRRPAVRSTVRDQMVVARLRDGVSLEAARRELQDIRLSTGGNDGLANGWQVRVTRLEDSLVGRARPALWAIFAGSGLLLLIACINFTGLLLGRGVERWREFEVRWAVGATRSDIARQVFAEHVVLASIAAALGTLFAAGVVPALLRFAPGLLPRAEEIRPDTAILLFSLGVVAAVVLLSTAMTTWFLSRRVGRRPPRVTAVEPHALLGWLTVAEIALAAALSVAAGVALMTYARLQAVDVGFATERLSVTRFAPMPASFRQMQQRLVIDAQDRDPNALWRVWMEGLLERVRAVPGVQRAAVGEYVPLEGRELSEAPVRPVGTLAPRDPRLTTTALVASVSPDYFAVLGIRGRGGRLLGEDDVGRSEPVAVVSRTAARTFWGHEDPVGQRLLVSNEKEPRRVVGVADDVRFVAPGIPPTSVVYLPFAQRPRPFLALLVDADVPPSAIAQPLHAALTGEKFRPVETVSLDRLLEATTARPRFFSWSAVVFGAISLILAASGIYTILALAVRQRRREMAVRLALGATAPGIVALVLRGVGAWLAVGLTAGVLGGVALAALGRGFLYETTPADPLVITAVVVIFSLVGVTAGVGPAVYARKSDPAQLLRSE